MSGSPRDSSLQLSPNIRNYGGGSGNSRTYSAYSTGSGGGEVPDIYHSSSLLSLNNQHQLPDRKNDFYEKFLEANRENLKQLKSNIEFLFKGAKIFSHFAFYPIQVLRWQCQINSESGKLHLTPITLVPVLYHLNYNGLVTFWKGCFSMAAYDGTKIVIESFLSELTSFEKNFDDAHRTNKLLGYFLIKSLSNILTTPIYSAAIYESVQSGVAKESLGIVDLLKESWNRITGYRYNYRTRLIPFWSLILPTTAYFVGFNVLHVSMHKIYNKMFHIGKQVFKNKRRYVEQVEEEVVDYPYIDAVTDLAAQMTAIVGMYPIETILNRLIVQGTRTIIDNTDTGYGVVAINTRYDGFIDCAQTILATEGVSGFYKGVGNLMIQAGLQYLVLKLIKAVAMRIYDSQWTTPSDANNIKSLMTTSYDNI